MARHPGWNVPAGTVLDAVRLAYKPQPVREPAFAVIDGLQRFPPGVQVQAAFAAAVILARTLNLDPHEMVAFARRQLPDLEVVESAASAISDYAKNELR